MRTGMRILIGFGVAGTLLSAVLYCTELFAYSSQAVVEVCEPTLSREAEPITLPYTVEGTDLIIKELATYEGPFLEDGTYEEVSDVAALVLHNTGEKTLQTADITVYTQENVLQFKGTWLPAESNCVLLEVNRMPYTGEPITRCIGSQEKTVYENLLHSQLLLQEGSSEEICVFNTSEYSVGKLRLLYKTYLAQTDMYMGGVTNELELEELKPGKTVCVTPPRYVQGYSKVVFVREIEEATE